MNNKSTTMTTNEEIINHISDVTISSISSRWGMGGGTAISVFGWLTATDLAVIIGIVITVLGFVVNSIVQFRRDRRHEQEHNLEMSLLQLQIKQNEEIYQHRLKLLNNGITDKERLFNEDKDLIK